MNSPSLEIRTPEGICFSQMLAGPIARFLAWSLDLFCILVLLTLVSYLALLLIFVSPGLAVALNTLGYFVISIGYGIVCEWFWRGQTLGKRVCRLRVVDAEGLRLQFHQVVIRNLLRFVDALPLLYFVGGVVCWFSPKCQRLGDIAGGTVVIRHPRLLEPDLDQVLPGKFNSLRQYPHLAARLRQGVSPAEAALAVQALLRRDHFQPEARVALFAELAAHFKSKVDFPPEATDGIADEQYIRNVVGVLYSEH
ncbi:MAG TPA: RDD family protein [Verrucomicrobiota bacterium]|nr:RDD family protein [Verrucomicrobiota bacterium]